MVTRNPPPPSPPSALHQVKLASCYYLGSHDTKIDYKEAVMWFERSAEAGNAVAQFALGYAYMQGPSDVSWS